MRDSSSEIAITGIGLRFPGAANPDELWDLLIQGRCTTGSTPFGHGGFLPDIDRFDPQFFGISPREARGIDPQHRLLLEVVWEALEDGAMGPESLQGSATGVYVGISTTDYGLGLLGSDPAAFSPTGTAPSIAANRISYCLDLRGPSLAVDTACSSSLVALQLACQGIRCGDITAALVAGVNLVLNKALTESFAAAGFIASDGLCKAFDARADGYVRSEGAAAVLLRPLSIALTEREPIHAVILGSAIGQDGRSAGLTAPNPHAQTAVVQAALANAGLTPTDIDYVECHGTGTRIGDPIEIKALGKALETSTRSEPLPIGSAKSNLGHLEAAAGLAGLVKAALVVARRHVPPTLHIEAPNPLIPFEALRITPARAAIKFPETDPMIAGVSSFGFGGTNAHVILRGPTVDECARPLSDDSHPDANDVPCLLCLHASSDASLREIAGIWGAFISETDARLVDIARTLNLGRAKLEYRSAIVARSREEASLALEQVAKPERRSSIRGIIGPEKVRLGEDPTVIFRFFGEMTGIAAQDLACLTGGLDVHSEWGRLRACLPGNLEAALKDALTTELTLSSIWLSLGVRPAHLIVSEKLHRWAPHLTEILGLPADAAAPTDSVSGLVIDLRLGPHQDASALRAQFLMQVGELHVKGVGVDLAGLEIGQDSRFIRGPILGFSRMGASFWAGSAGSDRVANASRHQATQGCALETSADCDPPRAAPNAFERLEALLRQRVAECLDLTVDEIDPDRSFFDMGMDSMIAVELQAQLEQDLACSIPETAAIEGPTVRRLMTFLAERVLRWSAPMSSSQAPSQCTSSSSEVPTASKDDLESIEQLLRELQ